MKYWIDFPFKTPYNYKEDNYLCVKNLIIFQIKEYAPKLGLNWM